MRSRFQARRIDPAPRRGLLSAIRNDWAPTLNAPVAQALVNFSRGIFDLGMTAGDDVGVESAQVAFHEIMYVGEAGVLSMYSKMTDIIGSGGSLIEAPWRMFMPT